MAKTHEPAVAHKENKNHRAAHNVLVTNHRAAHKSNSRNACFIDEDTVT